LRRVRHHMQLRAAGVIANAPHPEPSQRLPGQAP
jgi:hypothetical protein